MKSPKARGPPDSPLATEASFREQMETSLRNQMEASIKTHGMDDSRSGQLEGGGRRSVTSIEGATPPPLRMSTSNEMQQQQQLQPHEFTREQLLEQIVNPYFEDDSPAAEALRANAQVHIGKMGKVARSINAQALRKIAKRASMRSHFGNVRGKPPRVPPSHMIDTGNGSIAVNMYGIEEVESEGGEGEGDGVGEEKISPSSLGRSKEQLEGNDFGSIKSQLSESESHSLANTNSKDENDYGGQSKLVTPDNKKHSPGSKADVDVKQSPAVATQLPGHQVDHLHYSLQAMKKQEESVAALAPDGHQKDLPAEVVEGTMEAGRKVMKSVDPHDILKLTRWKRKKKKGKKGKELRSYVTGKVIDRQHELYAQSIAVMLGVRTSIAKTNGQITADKHKKRWVTDADFLTVEKYEFRPDGSADTPPHQLSHTFKFKDYAPVVFAYLRRLFGVNEFDFLLSVCGNANFIEFISNAKSGQFFFYSSDGKYMIKTMTNAESQFLRRILPDYFRHCCANPNTMLTKFCGMYRVKLYHLRRNVKFVIMNSVFYTDKPLQELYDLKGSIHGRDAPGQQVLKDNDLRARLPDGALALPLELRDRVRRQLIRDCNFLQKKSIMDYSMLVGVHYIPPKQDERDSITRASTRTSVRRSSFLGQTRRSVTVSGSSTDNNSVSDASAGSGTNSATARRSANEISDNLGPPMAMFDDILDEDDSSYLEGSEMRPPRVGMSPTSSMIMNSDIEKKKAQTIEQIYWPFHRLHDIHGHRRMIPGPCFHCKSVPCQCRDDENLLRAYNIPNFVAPLSDRKDGGFMMDTTGLDMPMKYYNPRHGEQLFEGKIFYMGVIDILQEYNSRKVVESRYRMLQGMDALEASCVAPRDYAARFVKFFDMYSVRIGKSARGVLSSFKKSTRSSVRTFYRTSQLEDQYGGEMGTGGVSSSQKSKRS